MTVTINRELDARLTQPVEESLADARALGLLPASTTETLWRSDDSQVQPAATAALVTLSPRAPFQAKGSADATLPDSWSAGPSNCVRLRGIPNAFGSVLWHDFVGLGANRKCIVWLDVQTFSSSTVVIGGTGNPSTLTVKTSGQRVSVPYALTALNDGRALMYVLPSLDNMSGSWFLSTLYGL